MKQWGHRWEGASDINKVQHKQDGVKDSAKVEGMVRQETSGRLGGDWWGWPYTSNRKRCRSPGPHPCTFSVPCSLLSFPLGCHLAVFQSLVAAQIQTATTFSINLQLYHIIIILWFMSLSQERSIIYIMQNYEHCKALSLEILKEKNKIACSCHHLYSFSY